MSIPNGSYELGDVVSQNCASYSWDHACQQPSGASLCPHLKLLCWLQRLPQILPGWL